MVERKYVDVNLFVYWLGGHPTLGRRSKDWIKRVEGGIDGEFVTSSLTLYETLVILAGLTGQNLKQQSFVRSVVGSITSLPGLKIIPLEVQDFMLALTYMHDYKLDYEDSLHLAAALRAGAKKIISNDSDFDRTPLERVF